MNTFAFIIHPIDPKRDVSRKFPFLGRVLSAGQIDFFSTFFPPVYISEIEGVISAATGSALRGWFVACPLTPARMLSLPEWWVYRKIIQTGRMAESLGAQILGLGAFTSVVGDGGLTVARALQIPVTTGDSFTVAVAVQSLREAARLLDIPLSNARAAILGATGAIGRVCAQLLAREAGELLLLGRDPAALDQLRSALSASGAHAGLESATDLRALRSADVILTVTSSLDALVFPEHLKPGSVICDVSRPRDVSAQVAAHREDVLVIDGGMVSVPGDVDFNFDFGFPAGKAYACMAETMALALEGRLESYTLGKSISLAQVEQIAEVAERHGFRLSGFRSFEKAVTPDQIETVRARARRSRILV